ncbi:T9SS type A sorting domain-containing protein [Candidatus Neomarinimicrobiota bacterium]
MKEKLPPGIWIGIILCVFPAFIWSQESAISRSSFNIRLASSGPSEVVIKTTAGAVFMGLSHNGATQVKSGFYAITVRQSSALAVDETGGLPTEYALRQNYPNPFNSSTTIQFDLPTTTEVNLVVYDLLGREVVWLVNEQMEPGYHQIIWKGVAAGRGGVSSGIYIAVLATPDFAKSIKMVLLK